MKNLMNREPREIAKAIIRAMEQDNETVDVQGRDYWAHCAIQDYETLLYQSPELSPILIEARQESIDIYAMKAINAGADADWIAERMAMVRAEWAARTQSDFQYPQEWTDQLRKELAYL